ncbi:uncharacterized protein LOC121399426 [Xenopus laevis]|uniref:Uncharacterized protein LOC121399426 n=1 Tax=Xenopus laevis TaxID=8355 RepID=A0A8J1M430_XENLA|nr:uncharacterized protein LOC121399426 [Xenopus laevis]
MCARVLNRCSLDLMVLVIEEVSSELSKVRKEIATLENTHQIAIHEATFAEFHTKLKNNVDTFKNDLLRFKREKLRKVDEDYQQHRVYRWLAGGGGTGGWRRGQPRWRKQRIRTLSTVDSSGESAGEDDTTSSGRDVPVTQHAATAASSSSQKAIHFQLDTLPTDRGPREEFSPVNTRSAGRAGRGASGGGRSRGGRPPRYPH